MMTRKRSAYTINLLDVSDVKLQLHAT